MSWQLSCLLCGQEDTDLVRMQVHAMEVHEVRPDDLRAVTRVGPISLLLLRTRHPALMFQWTLPDGRAWLRAIQEEGPDAATLAQL